jgi:hypothetical protein
MLQFLLIQATFDATDATDATFAKPANAHPGFPELQDDTQSPDPRIGEPAHSPTRLLAGRP